MDPTAARRPRHRCLRQLPDLRSCRLRREEALRALAAGEHAAGAPDAGDERVENLRRQATHNLGIAVRMHRRRETTDAAREGIADLTGHKRERSISHVQWADEVQANRPHARAH